MKALFRPLCFFIVCASVTYAKQHQPYRSFPKRFLFGAATSSYQTEGAVRAYGKGENVWDRVSRDKPFAINKNETAEIACDSYHKYKEDVALAAQLGLSHYRFSISWSRVLPNGFPYEINYEGLKHYSRLIKEIRSYGMIPVATLNHFDLPQPLQDMGGWLNVDLVDVFVDYCRIIFTHLTDVGYWLTINEPRIMCNWGYGDGIGAPGLSLDGTANYKCAYVVLKAHAAVYHMYKKEFKNYPAKIAIVLDGEWSEPASDSIADQEAAERRNQFEFGLYANPIYNGNWPQIVIDRVNKRSMKENFTKSRLPVFTDEEIGYIKGTNDFFSLNTYFTHLVRNVEEPVYGKPSLYKDEKVTAFLDPSWEVSPAGVQIVPWGTRNILKWIKDKYNNPEIFITENGVADDGLSLNDDIRIDFLKTQLNAILDAIYEDGVKVFGYTVWSLLDDFEWTYGYSAPMGLYKVDFTDPNRTRTPKESAAFYKKVATTLQIPTLPTNNNNSTINKQHTKKFTAIHKDP